MTLCAHKDTRRVLEPEVLAVDAPPFTATWHPFAHRDVLRTMYGAFNTKGIKIVKKEFSLSQDGNKMFGVFEVNQIQEGTEGEAHKMSLLIGVRNSLNKTFPLGICAGSRVFVCDNMAFSGDMVQFRKHTGGLDFGQMREMARKALDTVVSIGNDFAKWHTSLLDYPLKTNEFKLMTYDAMDKEILPPSKFNAFQEHYKEETALNGANLYSFFGANTRLLREDSFFNIFSKTDKIKGLVNARIEKRTVQ